jgi:L-fuconolactonase
MPLIDTHCHVSPYWYEPVESLLYHMEQNQVDQAVLIQYMGQYNNAYQEECVRRYPGRFASVVLVDTARPDAPQTLARLAEQGAKGVRLRADTRSPGRDPLAIWRQAEALGLPVSCGGNNLDFSSAGFAALVQTVPNLAIIVEHLGSINKPADAGPPYETRLNVLELARFPNVYLKVHGLGEFCHRTTPVSEPFPFETGPLSLLAAVVQAFGPARIMWGSDYPPVSGREGYRNSLELTRAQLAGQGEAALAEIFGGTAARLFDFS